ncbi:DUF3231 family protein [Paenibacillus spiritus]|uniref:DUF3231 family protein n=1 Tax=Paenibacillus spiritus TaxID=2496557 RepID=A0A5J5G9E3_9BACL|nr:DUF3231 family protein [Paenibacillus spiritus]KAA9004232.1 DUF3231 family protein [Paenibacillus spiritus]
MSGILGGNSKDEPMHYGEIYQVWQASMVAKGAISCYRAYHFHAGDKDLKKLLDSFIDQAELEVSECDKLLTDQGLALAPSMPDRAEARLEDIPAGARFTDPEIAAKLAADNASALVACSMVMGQSIREDIGALFAKYHASKAALGLKTLHLLKEKGWLVPPPLLAKRPE